MPACDCRVSVFAAYLAGGGNVAAVVSVGWGSRSLFAEWVGGGS